MNYEAYELSANTENTRFQFQSIGKRGIFEKVILLTPLSETIFNLALLDFNSVSREYDDLSVTDNGDMPLVLATAFAGIRLFMNSNPNKSVYFTGSTLPRTRLYQIAISKVYNPQNDEFIIYGRRNDIWRSFELNQNYDSFLIVKKS
jgi:hypothetical protein